MGDLEGLLPRRFERGRTGVVLVFMVDAGRDMACYALVGVERGE